MELIDKNKNSLTKDIGCLKLFRNDIDKIINIYVSQGYSVEFRDQEYSYNDLDEYADHNGNSIKYLALTFKSKDRVDGDVEIYFEGNTFSIRSSGRLDLSRAIYEYVLDKKWTISYILRPFNAFYLSIPFVLHTLYLGWFYPESLNLSMIDTIHDPHGKWIPLNMLGVTAFVFLTWLYQRYILGFSLERVHKSGLNKYRSEIIVGICVALVTLFITKLIDWIIG
jgi:hypothetical protein